MTSAQIEKVITSAMHATGTLPQKPLESTEMKFLRITSTNFNIEDLEAAGKQIELHLRNITIHGYTLVSSYCSNEKERGGRAIFVQNGCFGSASHFLCQLPKCIISDAQLLIYI